MTIKELKALFEGCDENENVCIDDMDDTDTSITISPIKTEKL